VILAAGLLVLVGLGLFVGGLLTGTTVLYWVTVAVCAVAAVLLVLSRRGQPAEERDRPPGRAAGERDGVLPPESPTRDATARELPGRTTDRSTPASGPQEAIAGPPSGWDAPTPGGAAPGAGTDEFPVGHRFDTPADHRYDRLRRDPPDRDRLADPRPADPRPADPGPADDGSEPVVRMVPPPVPPPGAPAVEGKDEPPVEDVEVTDLLLVVDLRDEVLVVDEHPRYHLEGCSRLAGSTPIPLPLDEARTDGFTPCGVCAPDRHMAQRERARRRT